MNKVILTGRATNDPICKQNGAVSFSLAVNEKKKDGVEESLFISCHASNRLGEIVRDYVRKGSLLNVIGRLWQRKMTRDDGSKYSLYGIYVDELDLLSKAVEKSEPKQDNIDDGELPF